MLEWLFWTVSLASVLAARLLLDVQGWLLLACVPWLGLTLVSALMGQGAERLKRRTLLCIPLLLVLVEHGPSAAHRVRLGMGAAVRPADDGECSCPKVTPRPAVVRLAP